MPKRSPVSIKQLARMANLSTATISRVLNNTGRFSDETRERVLSLVRDTGYTPNIAAKALRTRTARAIALVVPDIANEFFALIANAVERYFSEQAYSLFICNAGEDLQRTQSALAGLRGKGVDGVLYISRYPRACEGFDVPVVFLDRVPRSGNNLAMVSSDNYMAGRLAAKVLWDAGSRHPVMLCNPDDLKHLSTVSDRMGGFSDAWADLAGECVRDEVIYSSHSMVIFTTLSMSAARASIYHAVRKGMRFDGLFASSDIGAIGAMHGLDDAGLSVPGDINVVGCDDISFCEYYKPPLTTIRQDTAALGTEGARMLLAMMEGRPPANKSIKIPVEIVLRGSTRAAAMRRHGAAMPLS